MEIINKIIIFASSWLFILLHYVTYSVYGSVTFAFLPLGVFFCVSVCFKTSLTHWKKLKKKHSAVSFEHH